jgi:hypothetical protein
MRALHRGGQVHRLAWTCGVKAFDLLPPPIVLYDALKSPQQPDPHRLILGSESDATTPAAEGGDPGNF